MTAETATELMPMYAYKGVANERQVHRGRARCRLAEDAAPDPAQGRRARHELRAVARAARRPRSRTPRRAGCRATSISAASSAACRRPRSRRSRARWRRCSRSGIPLAESLGALVEQITNVRFKTPLAEVRTAVNEGSSLADALAKHPKLFDELFVSMVRAGEVAGNLDEVLTRLADFLESSQKLKSQDPGRDDLPDRHGRRRRRHHGRADDQGDPRDHLDVHAAGQDAAAEHALPDRDVAASSATTGG